MGPRFDTFNWLVKFRNIINNSTVLNYINRLYAQNHLIKIFENLNISHLNTHDIYEQETLFLLKNHIHKSQTGCDFVAYIELFSLQLAKVMNFEGKVINFELRINLRLFHTLGAQI